MRRTLPLLLSLLACACAGSSSPAGDDPLPASCDGTIPASLEYTVSLDHAGNTRTATVHVPPSYDGLSPLALVLNFHGLGSNANEQAFYSDMDAAVDLRGDTIVAYPQGLPNSDGRNSWDGGLCCQSATIDDVGFVSALLDQLESSLCVDTNRVYSTGMSNGGIFSYRLGCDLSDRIAAIAPVAGINLTTSCNPTRPVPLVHYHGTADTTVPYTGSAQYGIAPVPEHVSGWAASVNGCTTTPVETFRQGDVHCDTWSCGGPSATLCTVDGGGHTWPGAIDVPSLGYTTQDVDATSDILEFFSTATLKP